MLTVALGVLSVVASIVAIWGFWYQVRDQRRANALEKATKFPIRISSPVLFSSYYSALHKLRDHIINVGRYNAEVVIGINYWGSVHAALIGRLLLHRWEKVDVEVSMNDGVPKFRSLGIGFDISSLNGRAVLIVDNSIRTGRTLREVVDMVAPHAREVRTLVICRSMRNRGNFATPDFVMFESRQDMHSFFR